MPDLFARAAWPAGGRRGDQRRLDLIIGRLALDHQRHAVKIDESVGRIEDFHVAADRAFARESVPIQPANPLVQTFAERIFRFQSEQLASRVVQVSDSTLRIGNDDPFLDRIENCFEKTFLLRQTQKIILHFLRPDFAEATDQFFNKPGFHRSA